ncbi:hypothetical protein H9P43_001481 [Blastocladiella emersonii ATCC 22665]|nr:hypothetical protein H9P43_001481 [Blastocladiella emersonii ATCC 22665]
MKFANLFVSKSRLLVFDADVTVHSIESVPLISGHFYAKLKLPHGAGSNGHNPDAPDHLRAGGGGGAAAAGPVPATSGTSTPGSAAPAAAAWIPPSSHRAPLRDHAVQWNWRYGFDAEMTKDDSGVLLSWPFTLVIKHDRSEDRAGTERIGVLHLDLAHFAGTRSMTRKFLLQETKMNSTVKVTIAMTLKSGDPLFKVPELPNDLQIDLTRFTKSMIPSAAPGTLDVPASDLDASSVAQTRSGSMSETASIGSSRAASARVVNHASGGGGVAGIDGSGASAYGVSADDSSVSPASLQLAGALPHLPNADPRPSAAIVDDLFAQVLAASTVHPGSLGLPSPRPGVAADPFLALRSATAPANGPAEGPDLPDGRGVFHYRSGTYASSSASSAAHSPMAPVLLTGGGEAKVTQSPPPVSSSVL